MYYICVQISLIYTKYHYYWPYSILKCLYFFNCQVVDIFTLSFTYLSQFNNKIPSTPIHTSKCNHSPLIAINHQTSKTKQFKLTAYFIKYIFLESFTICLLPLPF